MRKLMWNIPATILFACMVPTIIIGIVAMIIFTGLRVGIEGTCDVMIKIFTKAT